MKIAIIGAGISGLTAAYRLHPDHQIEVFEANTYVGGHTNTIDVDDGDEQFAIDTGFIVFNDRTYPNFCSILSELGVSSQPTSMSFSVRCERTGLEYRGADLNGMFAQRGNLLRPRFLKMIRDIFRFNRESLALLESCDDRLTVREYFLRNSYGQSFLQQYFLPMAAAIWSCPTGTVEDFPIRFIVEFYKHHGLIAIKDRPQWRVIRGGSKRYVEAMTSHFIDRIHVYRPVAAVRRSEDAVTLDCHGESRQFDHVIFACHADQALAILGTSVTPVESHILSDFPFQRNVAVLHTDSSLLPRSRRAWASWNYFSPAHPAQSAPVTYYMNLLQGLTSPCDFCVTLNGSRYIDKRKIIREIEYDHPIITSGRTRAVSRHRELIGPNRTSFCGAYWGNGFHEDGVNSALAVCDKIQTMQAGLAHHVS